MFSLTIFYSSAIDGHYNRKVLEIFNINYKNVFFFLNRNRLVNNLRLLAKWSSDISRDLLTQCIYFKMLRTMSSLCVPNFDSAPSSMPKL